MKIAPGGGYTIRIFVPYSPCNLDVDTSKTELSLNTGCAILDTKKLRGSRYFDSFVVNRKKADKVIRVSKKLGLCPEFMEKKMCWRFC